MAAGPRWRPAPGVVVEVAVAGDHDGQRQPAGRAQHDAFDHLGP
ncbi:MAG: hypothetical protein ACRD0K_08685 [Egibacteraceae bacterium]